MVDSVTANEPDARSRLNSAVDLYDRRNRFRIECEGFGSDIAMIVTRRLTPGRCNPSTGKRVREIGLMRKYETHDAALADLESLVVDFDKRSAVPLGWDVGGEVEAMNHSVMFDLGQLPA